jgi:hypothetical protein
LLPLLLLWNRDRLSTVGVVAVGERESGAWTRFDSIADCSFGTRGDCFWEWGTLKRMVMDVDVNVNLCM